MSRQVSTRSGVLFGLRFVRWGTLLLLLGFVPICVTIPACSSGTVDEEEVEEEPELSEEELKQQAHAAKEARIASQVLKRKGDLRKNPLEFEQNKQNFEDVLHGARGTRYETEVTEAIEKIQSDFESYAQSQFDKLLPEIEKFVSEGDFRGAEDVLERWDLKRFKDLPAAKAHGEKDEQIALYFGAESEQTAVIDQAEAFANQNELNRAIALLEAYPDRYKNTPYYSKVRAEIPQYYDQYLADKKADMERLNIAWEPVEIDDYFGDFTPISMGEPEAWKASGGVIEGENGTGKTAILTFGEDNWIDYYIEFEIRTDQEELPIGIHREYRVATKDWQYRVHRVDYEGLDWRRLQLKVEKGRAVIEDPDEGEELYSEFAGAGEGGIAFFLEPGAKLAIRNVKKKVILEAKKEGAEGAEESDD